MAMNKAPSPVRRAPGPGMRSALALALGMVWLPAATAAEWRVTPTLEVRETWTDNVRLAQRGNERSDFVTELSPGINVQADGPRLKLQANYRLGYTLYAKENNADAIRHYLTALARAELVEDTVFLDATGNIGRYRYSGFGPQGQQDFFLDGNSTRVGSYRISPYMINRFGQTAVSELRYALEGVNSSVRGLNNTTTNRLSLSVVNGEAFKTLGWSLRHTQDYTDYSDLDSLRTRSTSANLRYRLSSDFSLTAGGGYESYGYQSVAEDPSGAFWSGGLVWTPSERTMFDVSVGHRFYGTSYNLSATHRSRRTVWNLQYGEDITTTQSQFLMPGTIDTAGFLDQLWATSVPDPVQRQQIIDAFIRNSGLPGQLDASVNTLTNRIFLQKRWLGSMAFNTGRTAVVLSAFDTRRELQSGSAADQELIAASRFALDGSTRQRGVNVLWNWRLAARTSLNVNASRTNIRSLVSTREDDNTTFSIGVSRELQPNLRGLVEYRHLRNSSNVVNDTRENSLSAAVQMRF